MDQEEEKELHQSLNDALDRALKRGLSEADIARKIRLSRPTINRWVHKISYPHVFMIPNLIVSIDKL